MADQQTALRSVRRIASTVTARAAAVLSTLAIVVGLVGWAAFWSNLARVHYAQGDLASALFTAGGLVAPAIALLGWYVGESLGADMPTPSVGPSIPSN